MKLEIEGLPHDLPPGEYDVEPVTVEYTKTKEPVMKLRFTGEHRPAAPLKPRQILVRLTDEADYMEIVSKVGDMPGVSWIEDHDAECHD